MTLFRYIVRQHLGPFFFGLSLIVFIFTMNLFFRLLGKIAGKGLELTVIIEYFALNLAWIIALAAPMAVLIATLSAFGRMAGDGEITAFRASGISPLQLITPAMFLGLLMTVGVGWFNNFVLPELNHRTKTLWVEISRKKPTLALEPDIFNVLLPEYVFHVKGVDPDSGRLQDVTIYDLHQPEHRSIIVARDGRLRFAEAEEAIVLDLSDGVIQRPSDRIPDSYEVTSFDSARFRLNAPDLVLKRGGAVSKGDREMTVKEMMILVRELRARGTDRPDHQYTQRRISALMVEVHKKFSIPIACLVFILLGAPLGMLAARGGMGVAGAVSLLFFTIYWVLLTAGEKLADRGLASPGVSMWIANVALTIVGLWMLWLARRRTTFPGVAWVGGIFRRVFLPHTLESKKQEDGK